MGEGTMMDLSINLIKSRNSYVAHFDILGTSALIERDIDRAWLNLCDLKKVCKFETLPLTQKSRNLLEEYFFSDTIVLISSDDSVASLHTIIARSLEIFREAYAEGIPLRGGIAQGETISCKENNMFTGKALLSAYKLGEQQQSLTICLDDETSENFNANPFHFTNDQQVVFDYFLQVKEAGKLLSRTSPCLNWVGLCDDYVRDLKSGESVYSCFSVGISYSKLNDDVKRKYQNTFEFIEYSKNLLRNDCDE